MPVRGPRCPDLNMEPETDAVIPTTDRRMIFNSGDEMSHSDSSLGLPGYGVAVVSREMRPKDGNTEFANIRQPMPIYPKETTATRRSNHNP